MSHSVASSFFTYLTRVEAIVGMIIQIMTISTTMMMMMMVRMMMMMMMMITMMMKKIPSQCLILTMW